MAVNEPRVFHPKLPVQVDLSSLNFAYDRLSDTLLVTFGDGAPRPGVSIPLSDFEYLRVDAETEAIIGVQIEDFLDYAVYENGSYLDFAEFAGIEDKVLARIRRAVEDRRRQMGQQDRQRALIEAWLKSLRLGQSIV